MKTRSLGANKFAVLTYGMWTTHFGADRSIVGRDIRVNGEPYQVTGVLPADVELPAVGVSMLVPFAFTPAQMTDNGRGNEFSSMIARLRPGATIEQANGQMKAIVARNSERLPARRPFWTSSGFGGFAIPLRDQLVGDTRAPLFVLQAGVLVVLLIACARTRLICVFGPGGSPRRAFAARASFGGGWRFVFSFGGASGGLWGGGGSACGFRLGGGGCPLIPSLFQARAKPCLNPGVLASPITFGSPLVCVFLFGARP